MADSVATKAILLIAGAVILNFGFRQYQPALPANALPGSVYKGQYFEKVVGVWALFIRVLGAVVSMLHIVVIYGLKVEPGSAFAPLPRGVCPHPSVALSSLTHTTPLFLLGFLFMATGGLLRVWSVTTLGRMFTFTINVVPDQVLITSGPYTYVRHPSYTGAFLLGIGCTLMYFLPGNYLSECGIMETHWKWVIWYWEMILVVATFSSIRRGAVEDGLLKQTFGKEWELYRQRVKYRFIPYIL